jgi:hypothetical protein
MIESFFAAIAITLGIILAIKFWRWILVLVVVAGISCVVYLMWGEREKRAQMEREKNDPELQRMLREQTEDKAAKERVEAMEEWVGARTWRYSQTGSGNIVVA